MFNDKQIAADVSELMLEIGKKLDTSLAHVQQVCPESEFVNYRTVVGQIMGEIFIEVMSPIYLKHPELKPLELK